MKSKFKKFNYFILVLMLTGTAALTILVNACKKTSSSYNDNSQLKSNILTSLPGYITLNNVPEGFKQMGQLHNAGLDTVFNTLATELRKHVSSVGISPAGLTSSNTFDYDSVLKSGLQKFLATNPSTAPYYRKLGTAFMSYAQNKVQVNKKETKTVLSLTGSDGSSSQLQSLLTKISTVLAPKFKQNCMLQLKAELEDINNTAAKTLSVGEANEVYAATSVGFASYQYWFKNYRKWYFAIQYPSALRKYSNFQLNYLYFKKNAGNVKTSSLRTFDDADTTWVAPELGEVEIYPDYADESGDDESEMQSIDDGLSTWWAAHGSTTVKADVAGAIVGGGKGISAGWAASGSLVGVVMDPEGAAVTIGTTTLFWGVGGGIGSSMTSAGWDTLWDAIGWK